VQDGAGGTHRRCARPNSAPDDPTANDMPGIYRVERPLPRPDIFVGAPCRDR
jgi:hypothetical protein